MASLPASGDYALVPQAELDPNVEVCSGRDMGFDNCLLWGLVGLQRAVWVEMVRVLRLSCCVSQHNPGSDHQKRGGEHERDERLLQKSESTETFSCLNHIESTLYILTKLSKSPAGEDSASEVQQVQE